MKKFYLLFSLMFLGVSTGFSQGETCADAVAVNPGVHNADGPSSGGGVLYGCFGNGGANADWYSFTPICDGVMTVSSDYPVNGSLDSRLSIFSGDCSNLVCEDFDDDGGINPNFSSVVNNLAVTGGVTYYIEWDDRWAQGAVPFEWTLDYTLAGGVTAVNSSEFINNGIISWNPVALEPGWDIQWGASGFSLGSGTNVFVDSTGGPVLNITGLNAATTYDYYIAIAGTGCFVGPYSFTTLPLCPGPENITTTQGFVDALLDWDPGFMETQWEINYGTAGTIIGNGTNSTQNQSSALIQNLASCTDYHWYVRSVCTNYNPVEYSFWAGPIIFSTDCVCPEPSNLGGTPNADPFAYDLTWLAGGTETEWLVQYGAPNFSLGNGTIVTANSNPFTLTGLVPDTEYCYFLKAVCGSTPDSTSNYIGPFCFTTDTYCPEPVGLSVNSITTISAVINWAPSGSAFEWEIEWGIDGFAQGAGTASIVLANNVMLTGLTPDEDYCYYVRARCGASIDSSSIWAGPYCFSTLAACPAVNVSTLDAFNITNTAATLDWQAGANETMWNVEWGVPGFTPGTGTELGSGSVSGSSDLYATGLNIAAPYEFWVQADCGGLDGASLWTGPYFFTTLLANDDPCGAVELLVDGNVNLHTNVGGTLNGEQNIEPPINNTHSQMNWYKHQNGSLVQAGANAPVWFRFKAPASGKVEVSTMNDITQNANQRTEIAVYETGDCGIYSNFNLLGANTYGTSQAVNGINPPNNAPRGSLVLLCDLNPGQQYYVMVDHLEDSWENNTIVTWGPPGPGTFGISVTDIPATDAGIATPLSVCGDGTDFDLFGSIDQYGSTTGTWYNPSVTNPNFSTPGSSSMISLAPGTYSFDYVIANVCGADTVSTTIEAVASPSAGQDGTYASCNTEDIHLITHLNGILQFGGDWVDPNGVYDLSSGIFDSYGVQYGTYPFWYIVAGNGVCPADTATLYVNLHSDCLGLEDNDATALEVYPNPVLDVLTISGLNVEGNALISVYDAQGKVVFRNDVNNTDNYTIDMTDLDAGIYTVEITSSRFSKSARIIKT